MTFQMQAALSAGQGALAAIPVTFQLALHAQLGSTSMQTPPLASHVTHHAYRAAERQQTVVSATQDLLSMI